MDILTFERTTQSKRNFDYEDEKISYSIEENNNFYYSDQFDINKIFSKIGLIAHLIGNDIEKPLNNSNIEISDVTWDVELNSMEYTLEFKSLEDLEDFIELFLILSPKNSFEIELNNSDFKYYNSDFKYRLCLCPIDSPYNGG